MHNTYAFCSASLLAGSSACHLSSRIPQLHLPTAIRPLHLTDHDVVFALLSLNIDRPRLNLIGLWRKDEHWHKGPTKIIKPGVGDLGA